MNSHKHTLINMNWIWNLNLNSRNLNFILTLLIVLSIVSVGCTTARTSHTARTGLEQLLISGAIDQTLDKTPLPPLQGRKVFLEDKYLDSVDKGYLLGSLRQRILNQGGQLTDKKEDSEVTIEVYAGAVGTDSTESFVGMPGLAIPGMPIELPEVRLFEKSSQFGTAKLNLVAYATESGQLLFDSGQALARADESRWSVMGVGPFHRGSVPRELKRANEGLMGQAMGEIRHTASLGNSSDNPTR